MKYKILLCILLFGSIASIASENSGVPKWSEFCPTQYYNAQYKTIDKVEIQKEAEQMTKMLYCHSDNKFVDISSKVLILPAIDCWTGTKIAKSKIRKENTQFNQNLDYWNARKKDFEANIQTCNIADNNTKAMCYMKIRELEMQKNRDIINNSYNEAMLREQRIMNLNQSQQTNQLIQMNQNLNNINYNLLLK